MKLIEDELNGKGYSAEIVIGAPEFSSFPYIKELEKLAAKNSSAKDIIHFTIDIQWQNDKSPSDLKRILDFSFNENVVYNIGITVCYPFTVATTKISKLAAINKAKGIRL